ncbi:capsid and scaffold protein [Klebsiella phage KN3-1]|uniref:Capsid and scaffold protein n=1 Tax=Klebsiella phage KN3-1 TaxID=2282630 RepID=A0A3T0ZBW4_BPK31|nr:capsid and scaffold protein [Klebsiella phage KN3-1]BBF66861.1 capsid and scaffold protein [Klebsiella phage KN3-1]
MTHRVLSDNLVSLILSATSTFQSEVFQLDGTDSGTVLEQAHNVLFVDFTTSCRESVLLVGRFCAFVRAVITSATSGQVRNLDDFEAHHVTDRTTLRVNQSRIVRSVRHQSRQNRRVHVRGGVERTVVSRDVVLGQSCTSDGQLCDNRLAQFDRVSQVSLQTNFQQGRFAQTSDVLVDGIREVNQTSQLGQYRTISSHRQRFTNLRGVLGANVIVVHRVFDVVNQHVSGQQAINVNGLLGVLDVFTFVIQRLARLQVSSLGAANHRELCGLTGADLTLHVTVSGHRGTSECGQDFTAEYFQE